MIALEFTWFYLALVSTLVRIPMYVSIGIILKHSNYAAKLGNLVPVSLQWVRLCRVFFVFVAAYFLQLALGF